MTNKKQKFGNELVVNDKIKIGGLVCTINKVEDIFHYVPKARVRLSLTIDDSTENVKLVLFFPSHCQIVVEE